jgi:hypothetical protein
VDASLEVHAVLGHGGTPHALHGALAGHECIFDVLPTLGWRSWLKHLR